MSDVNATELAEYAATQHEPTKYFGNLPTT